ncbi:MAG: methyltransferase domain-containing protein [Thermomicrobiales bacterium]
MSEATIRRDTVWQQEDVARSYFSSRRGIPLADVQLDVMRRLIEEHKVTVRNLLDFGAGDGAAAAVHSWQPVDRMVLVDLSHPMLDEARLRFAGVSAEIDYIEGDLLGSEWLPNIVARGPYDLVVSRYAIHHLPHDRKKSLYHDILGLLEPGGLFINIEHVKSASPVYQKAFDHLLIEGINATGDDAESIQATTEAYYSRQDKDTNILASVEDQCEWLREIGFVDVDCAFKIFELAVFVGKKPVDSAQ